MVRTVEPMTAGSICKRMTVFALPLMLGNFFQQLYNTVDSLIVGNFISSASLAAVSSSGSLIFMLIGLLIGISTGAGVVVARYFGAGDMKKLSMAVHTTVFFGLAAGVVMTALGMLMVPHILLWMDTPESVMPEALAYLRIYFAGSVGFVMYNIFVGILQGLGDSRHPLYCLIASSVLNFLLDIIFIVEFHLGVEGAALATVISQLISAALCSWKLFTAPAAYRLSLKKLRPDGKILADIIRIGLPAGVQNSIIALANVIVQSHINAFDEAAMAGCGAYSKIQGFAFLPVNSFAMAITTFVSQNLGAGLSDRARKGAHFGLIVTVCLSELIGFFLLIFSPQLLKAFSSDPAVIAYGVNQAHTDAPFYFLLAFSYASASVLRGVGKSVTPMLIMIFFWCGIRVSFLSIAMGVFNSIFMVYIAYPISWALSSFVFCFYLWKDKWLSDYLNKKQQHI